MGKQEEEKDGRRKKRIRIEGWKKLWVVKRRRKRREEKEGGGMPERREGRKGDY